MLADPEVQLALAGRSGPVVVEIEYRVSQESARAFYNIMLDNQLFRQRTGAYGWSIARDIADPELWTERYYCPTWLDYLRQRNRSTQSERALDRQAAAFHIGPELVSVRRMLERPFGSVRWSVDGHMCPVITSAEMKGQGLRRLKHLIGRDICVARHEGGIVDAESCDRTYQSDFERGRPRMSNR